VVSQTLLIVEANPGGHRLYYVRLLVEAAREHFSQVVVALGANARDSDEFLLHLDDIREKFELLMIQEPFRASSLIRLTQAEAFDLVLVPDGDLYLARLALRRPSRVPMNLLVMRDPREEPPAGLLRTAKLETKRLFIGLLGRRHDTQVFTLRGPGYVGGPQELYVNDPIDVRMPWDAISTFRNEHLSPNVFWFGLVGVLSQRKHPGMVIEALLSLRRADVGLAIAGPIEPNTRADVMSRLQDLRDAGISVALHETRMSNAEMSAAIGALDCVVMAYSTGAPPSTLGKSYVLGTRCIVAGSPALRAHAKRLGHGFSGPLSVASIAGMMKATIDCPQLDQADPPEADVFASRLLTIQRRIRR
jgi:hypothetical protein